MTIGKHKESIENRMYEYWRCTDAALFAFSAGVRNDKGTLRPYVKVVHDMIYAGTDTDEKLATIIFQSEHSLPKFATHDAEYIKRLRDALLSVKRY